MPFILWNFFLKDFKKSSILCVIVITILIYDQLKLHWELNPAVLLEHGASALTVLLPVPATTIGIL